MRLSYSEKLIELDRKRRTEAYGGEAKRFHLKIVAFTTALLYVVLRVVAWFCPKSVSYTWIDTVLVEIVEDDWLGSVCSVLGWVFVVSLSLLLLLFLVSRRSGRRRSSLSAQQQPPSHFLATGGAKRVKGLSVPQSSIAVKLPAMLNGLPKLADAPVTAALGTAEEELRLRQHHKQQSIRTDAELDRFLLAKESTKDGRAEGSPTATNAATAVLTSSLLPSGGGGGVAFGGPLVGCGGAIATGPSSGIRVQYSGGVEQSASAQPVDTEWASLGIHSTERSLVKARRWLSNLCQDFVEKIAACDRWCAERQISAFDCMHCLQETVSAPRPSVTAGVGFGFAPAATQAMSAAPEMVRKLDVFLGEREKLARQAQSVQNFDTIVHLDQRLSLEEKLDPSSTFPQTSQLSVAEQQAQRQYVIKRLRAFASQKTLSSYRHNRGDAELWREVFFTDAHLLIHIVRVCVDGLVNYVKFPHQPLNPQQDLAIFVGDTGEPYFYVRYRSGPIDKTYATHQGANSLFEALIIFAAVVRAYHNDSYGGIRGVMDLSKTGLLDLL